MLNFQCQFYVVHLVASSIRCEQTTQINETVHLIEEFSVYCCGVAGWYDCRLGEYHGEGLYTVQIQTFNVAFVYYDVHHLL